MALYRILARAISDFESRWEKLKNNIELIKNESDAIRDELRDYKLLLNRVFKLYMYSKYEQTQADIYFIFMQSLSVQKTAKWKRALQGRTTDANGELIDRVRVSIDNKKDSGRAR